MNLSNALLDHLLILPGPNLQDVNFCRGAFAPTWRQLTLKLPDMSGADLRT